MFYIMIFSHPLLKFLFVGTRFVCPPYMWRSFLNAIRSVMKVILTLFCRRNKPEHINYYNFPLDLLSTLQNYAQKFSGIELL